MRDGKLACRATKRRVSWLPFDRCSTAAIPACGDRLPCRCGGRGEGHHLSARAELVRVLDRERLVVVKPFGQVVAVLALAGEVDAAAAHLSCLEVRGDPR